jgi:hypothetical protein
MIRVAAAISVALLGVLALISLGGGRVSAPAAQAAENAGTATVAAIEASFSPNRAGARTATTFGVHLSGGQNGIPTPVRRIVVRIPAGLGGANLEWPTTAGCSRATLQRRGARGCPARSQIGSGSALIAWREGSRTVTESAKLWEFVGPTNGAYQLQILGEGTTPIRRRVVSTVALAALAGGPYSAALETAVPAIPTRPGEPNASIVSFSLTTGNARQPRFSGGGRYGGLGLFVPSPCPAGGYPWAAEFTYADGSTQQATTAASCP